jgi:T-complex protein 1 subunit gamma
MEVIPRTLATNCGAEVVRVLTELRAKHNSGKEGVCYGINGNTGKIESMETCNIWDPISVKL